MEALMSGSSCISAGIWFSRGGSGTLAVFADEGVAGFRPMKRRLTAGGAAPAAAGIGVGEAIAKGVLLMLLRICMLMLPRCAV